MLATQAAQTYFSTSSCTCMKICMASISQPQSVHTAAHSFHTKWFRCLLSQLSGRTSSRGRRTLSQHSSDHPCNRKALFSTPHNPPACPVEPDSSSSSASSPASLLPRHHPEHIAASVTTGDLDYNSPAGSTHLGTWDY